MRAGGRFLQKGKWGSRFQWSCRFQGRSGNRTGSRSDCGRNRTGSRSDCGRNRTRGGIRSTLGWLNPGNDRFPDLSQGNRPGCRSGRLNTGSIGDRLHQRNGARGRSAGHDRGRRSNRLHFRNSACRRRHQRRGMRNGLSTGRRRRRRSKTNRFRSGGDR